MKKLLLWVLLLIPFLVNGQSWEIYTHDATYNGVYSDRNGGIYHSSDFAKELIFMDRFGNRTALKNNNFDYYVQFIYKTKDGRFLIGADASENQYPLKLILLDQRGNLIWKKTVNYFDGRGKLSENSQGDFVLFVNDLIETYDQDWYLLSNKKIDFLSSINTFYVDKDANFVIQGISSSNSDSTTFAKVDNLGTLIWKKQLNTKKLGTIGELNQDNGRFVAQSRNGYKIVLDNTCNLLDSIKLPIPSNYFKVVKDGFFVFNDGQYADTTSISKYNFDGTKLNQIKLTKTWINSIATLYEEGTAIVACTTLFDGYQTHLLSIDKDGNLHTGNISGKVNKDENQNCLVEASEKGMAGMLIKAEPGPLYSFTDSSGLYSLAVDTGKTYLVKPIGNLPYLHTYTCGNERTIILNNGRTDTSKIDFNVRQEKCPALSVRINNSSYIKCFDSQINVSVSNYGTDKAENVSLSLALPSEIKVKSINKPYIFSGGNYLWSFGTIEAGEEILVTIQDSIDCNAETGKRVVGKAVVTTSSTCSILNALTDTSYFSGVLRGSFDPNDKSVFPSAVNFSDYQLGKNELNYHINFQNTGTGPAYKVVVMDTLSDKLDFESIREIRTSHSSKINVVSTNPLVVAWVFDKINLPFKDENEPASHGFIDFVISLKDDLENNTEIENRAAIYFDFNEPIITNTASVLISDEVDTESYIITSNEEADSRLSTISIAPNPMAEKSLFTLPKHIQLPAQFLLFSNEGKLIRTEEVKQSEFILKRETLLPGIYHYVIQGAQQYFSGNILLK